MNAKKAILVLVVAFLGFWMFNDPNGLAQAAKDASGTLWSVTQDLFGALIRFINALT